MKKIQENGGNTLVFLTFICRSFLRKPPSIFSQEASTMIHTFAIIRPITNSQLQFIMESARVPQATRTAFTNTTEGTIIHNIIIRRWLNDRNPETGIHYLKLIRIGDRNRCNYYAIIVIEPLVTILGYRTVDLFQANSGNIHRLVERFHEIMSSHFDDHDMYDLVSWSCHRIDYTFNFRFDNDNGKNLFLYLSRKTSRYVRKHRNILPNLKKAEQSTAESNKSVKVMFYDKRKQILETYYPDNHRIHLANSAYAVVRFEVQCKHGRIRTIKDRYGFENRSILNYLNEDIAVHVLLTEYEYSIGSGDFYTLYHAQKRINESHYTETLKRRLYQCLQLISQARHIDVAQKQFVLGTRIKRTDIIVKGSRDTFIKRLKQLKAIGINPMPIPKEFRITYFYNPKYQMM